MKQSGGERERGKRTSRSTALRRALGCLQTSTWRPTDPVRAFCAQTINEVSQRGRCALQCQCRPNMLCSRAVMISRRCRSHVDKRLAMEMMAVVFFPQHTTRTHKAKPTPSRLQAAAGFNCKVEKCFFVMCMQNMCARCSPCAVHIHFLGTYSHCQSSLARFCQDRLGKNRTLKERKGMDRIAMKVKPRELRAEKDETSEATNMVGFQGRPGRQLFVFVRRTLHNKSTSRDESVKPVDKT